ncbi:MmcQ/YjbR family DNA-binding protein [Alloscardovia venturai]|uniref:MmcQ/YjbR family DNA-binding protein n=1 Tax=Alloscardovia venturai TaxID=1769421 RepID=A0ABW2Y8R4_9BIFI
MRDFYHARIENPWHKYPAFFIIRHEHGKKWFGLIMAASEYTLGVSDDREKLIDAINIKLDPRDVEFFKDQPGFLPAYHMNKTHWVTVLLNGTVPDETLEELIKTSHDLTE